MIIIVSSGHKPDDERIYHREIKSLLKTGYDIRYFTRWDGEMDLSENNLQHINVERKNYPIKKYIQFVSGKINDASVLHIHEFEMLRLAKQMKKKHGIKVIYDVHENLREMWDTFSSKKGLMKKMINKSLSFFELSHLMYVDDVILANKVFGENYYEKKGLKTTVVENFPPLEKISGDHPFSDTPMILYQGQISFERGISVLIDAFKLVLDSNNKTRLRIIGSPRTDKFLLQIKDKIEKMKLSEYVDIMDAVSHDVIWEEMRNANVGVIPFLETPLVKTNTPTKLFEYMAAGCAIVATDVPPVRHFLDGAGELVVPNRVQSLYKGILTILQNEDIYNDYINKSMVRVKQEYNWPEAEKKLLSVYKNLTR